MRLASGPGTDPPGDPHDSTRADLADVATWAHTPIDHPSEELYASGHARLVRAGPLAVGGHAGRALEQVRRVAESDENLLPAMREALQAHCTVGEICGALRELWGTYDAHG